MLGWNRQSSRDNPHNLPWKCTMAGAGCLASWSLPHYFFLSSNQGDKTPHVRFLDEHRRALGSQLSIVKRVAKILKFSSQKRDSDAAAAPPPTTDALRLKLLEQALRVVANVVAEVDSNRLLFLDKTSALEILVNILRDFGDNSTILRNCCGAIANIACDNRTFLF